MKRFVSMIENCIAMIVFEKNEKKKWREEFEVIRLPLIWTDMTSIRLNGKIHKIPAGLTRVKG